MTGEPESRVFRMRTTKRGRPSDYDSQEDAIILSTSDTAEVKRLLKQAGKKDRSSDAIISRRKKLREEEARLRQSESDGRAEALFQYRRRLTRQLEVLKEEQERVEEEIEKTNAELRELI